MSAEPLALTPFLCLLLLLSLHTVRICTLSNLTLQCYSCCRRVLYTAVEHVEYMSCRYRIYDHLKSRLDATGGHTL